MRLHFAPAMVAVALLASPALAHNPDHDYPGGPMHDPREQPMAGYGGYDPAARDAWLADCRQRLSSRDSGLGGAVIGGAIGGIAGNRIAGRHNRTVGTIAGAAVGAAAGAAIDKAEDTGHNRDECEAYLDDYYARYQRWAYPGAGYGYPAYSQPYGYPAQPCCMAQPMMAIPVMMVPVVQAKPNCTETVEYVYEDVPVRPRRHWHPAPDKRIRIAPDKRVPAK